MHQSRKGIVKLCLIFTAAVLVLCLEFSASAQVVISSVIPPNGATGISVTSSVVFTFSQPMETSTIAVTFVDNSTREPLFLLSSWSEDGAVVTWAPFGSLLPGNTTISWSFTEGARSASGTALSGTTTGAFSTETDTAPAIVFTNMSHSSSAFSFDLNCSIGQVLTVEYATNLSTAPWLTLLTTNPTVPRIHFSDPRAATNRSIFYRARTGL